MKSSLDMLRLGLGPFASGLQAPESLADVTAITRARQQVIKEHGGAAIFADARSIMSAIMDFRRDGKIEGYRELKYICLGMGSVDADGWCAIADHGLRNRVIQKIESQTEIRRRIRCFQAALSSFWHFPLNKKQTSDESKTGWLELRKWLRTEHQRLLNIESTKPDWFTALTKYTSLLSEQPCEYFAVALLHGDTSELNDAIERLAIASDSWVLEESIIAQIRAGCALNDDGFKDILTYLVNLAAGRDGMALGELLRIRGIAMLVSRYNKCRENPEHIALRDAAVRIIGNPWLRRANWDAWVVDDAGKPDNQCREMVNGWLKRRLITDFFELLSVDGTGDKRRVDYWLCYEPLIDDMWFALGKDANKHRGEQFNEFRNRAKGRLLSLDGTTPDNNAFVMRIGRYLMVEFGVTGNAMYVFEWDSLGQPLLDTLTSGMDQGSVNIRNLKYDDYLIKLSHRDIKATYRTKYWEQHFDSSLVKYLGRRPTQSRQHKVSNDQTHNDRFSQPVFDQFIQTHRLRVEDNRLKQGALWVIGVEQPNEVVALLKKWGFKPRNPKGWFKE